jgi:cytochrome P450
MSGRVFVGPKICRDEDWIEASIAYTLDTFMGSAKLKRWTLSLRPLLAFFFRETRRVKQHHATARRLLVPIMKARAQSQKDPKYVRPNDMIQWIMDQSSLEKNPPSFGKQAEMQLLIGLAGIHTTTLTCTQALFDLASRPKYIEPLREEVRRVMDEADGKLEKKDIAKLVKLDSFIKESQRMSPPDMGKFRRSLLQHPI